MGKKPADNRGKRATCQGKKNGGKKIVIKRGTRSRTHSSQGSQLPIGRKTCKKKNSTVCTAKREPGKQNTVLYAERNKNLSRWPQANRKSQTDL